MKVLVALLFVSLAFAGCTTESSYETPPTNEAGEYVVMMTQGNRFVPAQFEVPAGAVVSFEHEGGAHNVKSDANLWTAGEVGTDFKLTTTQAMIGDNAFHCVPHEGLGMIGTMRVTA